MSLKTFLSKLIARRRAPTMSTREDPITKRDAFAVGANDYIVKLPDKIELIARIRCHAQAYLGRRQRDAAYAALQESQRQLMAANIELLRLSNMDGLTGLNNRRRFDEYAANEWRRALRVSALRFDQDVTCANPCMCVQIISVKLFPLLAL